MNPLLDFSGLPRYRAVTADHITPAVDALLAECRAADARLTASDVPATWKDFVEPLADVHERLERAWGVVGHLHGVLDTPLLREAYNANQPKVVDYYTELGQNLALFEKYKALRGATEYTRLSAPQQRIIDHAIRDFRLSGAELSADKKAQFAQIQAELAKLQTRFSENVLDATNAFDKLIERAEELAGVPDDVLEGFKAAAERDGKTGWKLSLQLPSYLPVMQYAENRTLREELYRAHATRAAEFGKSELNNTPLIRRILELRDDEAKLLGYRDFAEVSLVPKMAKNPEQVLSFLRDLADKSLPYARRDVEELRTFARDELGLKEMESWDIPFVSEKLRAKRYAFSEQEVKQYFPEHKVLEGMFRVVETLYGISIEPDEAETWDPNVRFFRVRARGGATIGQFYLDPYARETKRGGAWMDEALCLQETKMEDAVFPRADIEAAGYRTQFMGQKTYNGVAILSRIDATDVVRNIPAFEDEQKRVIAGTLGDVRVICCYVPNGQAVGADKYEYKLRWLGALSQWLKEELARYPKLVVVGDYNIAPDDRDVHDPKQWEGQILCSEPERAAYQRILGLGLHDSFRLFEQSEKSFTWWDYRMNGFKRNLGLRIDHILVSAAIVQHCKACAIDLAPRKLERPSDHAPVVAELDL